MKFTVKKASKFGWKGLKGWAYNSKENYANESSAFFEVTGSHGMVKNIRSDRVYYVVAGKGEFIIDKKVVSVKKSDVIVIPKNTPYDYKATKKILKLFLVHIPAYDPKYERRLER